MSEISNEVSNFIIDKVNSEFSRFMHENNKKIVNDLSYTVESVNEHFLTESFLEAIKNNFINLVVNTGEEYINNKKPEVGKIISTFDLATKGKEALKNQLDSVDFKDVINVIENKENELISSWSKSLDKIADIFGEFKPNAHDDAEDIKKGIRGKIAQLNDELYLNMSTSYRNFIDQNLDLIVEKMISNNKELENLRKEAEKISAEVFMQNDKYYIKKDGVIDELYQNFSGNYESAKFGIEMNPNVNNIKEEVKETKSEEFGNESLLNEIYQEEYKQQINKMTSSLEKRKFKTTGEFGVYEDEDTQSIHM